MNSVLSAASIMIVVSAAASMIEGAVDRSVVSAVGSVVSAIGRSAIVGAVSSVVSGIASGVSSISGFCRIFCRRDLSSQPERVTVLAPGREAHCQPEWQALCAPHSLAAQAGPASHAGEEGIIDESRTAAAARPVRVHRDWYCVP
jgi:hypothetical protein